MAIDLANTTTNLVKGGINSVIDMTPVKQFLAVSLKVIIAIIAIWLVIKIISAVKRYRLNKRIMLTYQDVKEMKKKLVDMDSKLDKIIGNTEKKKPQIGKKK